MSFSSERLRMTRGKVDPVHQKSSPFSADPSSSADDCFELVLENGQIMMQGQSNRPRKGSISNNLPPGIPKAPGEIIDTDSSKLPKLTTVEHLPNDFALFAPTFEMGLDNEELVSWFDYAFPEPFNHYACSDMLPELSGVTMNGFPGENNLPSVIKRSSSNDMSAVSHSKSAEANASSSQQGIIPNAVSSAKGINESTTKEMSPLMQNQHMVLRSGNSELATSDVCNTNQLDSRSSVHYPSQMRGSTDVKLQNKFDERHHRHDNRPTTTNFSYFSEFASSHCQNSVANSGPLYCSTEKLGNEYKGHIWSGSHPMEAAPVNPSVGFLQQNSNFQVQPSLPSLNVVKESLASDVLRDPPPRQVETVCSQDNAIENSAKDDKSPKQALGSVAKRAGSGEKMLIAEPTVVASSVCSGNNSIERASNDPSSSYMKRKLSETGETEGPAEEVEQESIGPRKNAAAHTGLKRSRTAQVHNLSERRRRDRINEKMRALQELLPNCNKADKASMLEEAIEYLKTLQLQVQMLSMGARLFIPPMMVSAAMQHGGQMPYFQTMPMAMSAMGLGMGMQELNNGMMQMPYHMPSPCYTLPSEPSQVPSSSSTFNGLADGTKQGFVHPAGQGAQKLMLHIPNSPTNDPTLTGNISSVYSGVDVRRAAPLTSPNEVTQNVGSGTQG